MPKRANSGPHPITTELRILADLLSEMRKETPRSSPLHDALNDASVRTHALAQRMGALVQHFCRVMGEQ